MFSVISVCLFVEGGHVAITHVPPLITTAVVPVCVLLTHFCFNVRLFSQVCFICFNVRLF